MLDKRALRQLAIFEDLTDKERSAMAALCEKQKFAKGETLFTEERQATRLFVLQEGRVVIMMNAAHGNRALVYSVQPGQAFSWSALVPPRRYTASAVAVEPSEAIVVDGRKLLRLFKKDPAIGYKIMCRVAQLVSKRLRHTRLQLLNIHEGRTAEESAV